MGYYMRFFSTDARPVTLIEIDTALKNASNAYLISNITTQPSESGDLMYGDEDYGQIEINRKGDELFEEEIKDFIESVQESTGRKKRFVLQTLKNAQVLVAIQVLFSNRNFNQTLEKLDPFWEYLLENYSGLIQADGEGFYDGKELIFEI